MRVLVTGADGFVGRYMTAELADAGHEPVAAVHKESDLDLAAVTFDVRDSEAVAKALAEVQPDGVVHLAGQASPALSWKDPTSTYEVNVIGASNVLEALPDGARAILVGSAQVYGEAYPGRPFKETDPIRPPTPYAVSKAAQEWMGLMYHAERGAQVCMTRSFNHIGPSQSDAYVVGRFAAELAELAARGGGELEVGRLDAVRDFLDVRDVVRAYRMLLEEGEPGEVYNVCSGKGIEIEAVLEEMIRSASLEGKVTVTQSHETRPGDPSKLIGDNARIRGAVGWDATIPLDESLEQILEWHLSKEGRNE